MTQTGLGKMTVILGRMRLAFAIVSILAATCLVAALVPAMAIWLGDHGAIAPISSETPTVYPPAGLAAWLHELFVYGALAMLALAVAVWLLWLTTSSQLVRRAGAQGMRYSPAVSAAWHFVPVMSSIMPMLVLVELEAATKDPADWKDMQPGKLAATTWLVARLSGVAFGVSCNFTAMAETSLQYGRGVAFVSASTVPVLAGLAMANLLMRRMSGFQGKLATT